MPLLVCEGEKFATCFPSERGELLTAMKCLLLTIPSGRVSTYSALARALGVHPRYAGTLLSMNDNPIVVPCHRIVRSDGSLGGYSGPGGVSFKRRLLELEGVPFCYNGRVCPQAIIRELPYTGESHYLGD